MRCTRPSLLVSAGSPILCQTSIRFPSSGYSLAHTTVAPIWLAPKLARESANANPPTVSTLYLVLGSLPHSYLGYNWLLKYFEPIQASICEPCCLERRFRQVTRFTGILQFCSKLLSHLFEATRISRVQATACLKHTRITRSSRKRKRKRKSGKTIGSLGNRIDCGIN